MAPTFVYTNSHGCGDIVCNDVGITYVWDVLQDGTFFCDLFYHDDELDQLYVDSLNIDNGV